MGSIITDMVERPSVEEMVERVEWMSPIHYEILMFFDEHDIWITPVALAHNIDYNRAYVSRECQSLNDADLLESRGRSYRLTERGRSFLAGDLDADDLDNPDTES